MVDDHEHEHPVADCRLSTRPGRGGTGASMAIAWSARGRSCRTDAAIASQLRRLTHRRREFWQVERYRGCCR